MKQQSFSCVVCCDIHREINCKIDSSRRCCRYVLQFGFLMHYLWNASQPMEISVWIQLVQFYCLTVQFYCLIFVRNSWFCKYFLCILFGGHWLFSWFAVFNRIVFPAIEVGFHVKVNKRFDNEGLIMRSDVSADCSNYPFVLWSWWKEIRKLAV